MNEAQTFDYPLMDNAAEWLRTATGRRLADLTLEAVATDQLSADDIRIHVETLRAQAEIARIAGHPQLATNLTRAAELTAVPNEEILQMYEQLRPGRATYDELISLAARLEDKYQAPVTAGLVREAASAYQARKLLKQN